MTDLVTHAAVTVTVTFALPAEAVTRGAVLAGDFNDWSTTRHPLARRDDGCYAVTLDVPVGRTYEYRFWVDDCVWANDWHADDYVPNEYGGISSLLDLRPGSARVPLTSAGGRLRGAA